MNVEFHRQNLILVNNTIKPVYSQSHFLHMFLIRCSVQNMIEQNSFSKLERGMALTVTKI